MIPFTALNPQVTADHLGIIPSFLDENDPAPAREQFDANYQHGGGWRPMKGWTLHGDLSLTYEEGDDPPLMPYAFTVFHHEIILIYPYAWVVILQRDGSFEVSRMD